MPLKLLEQVYRETDRRTSVDIVHSDVWWQIHSKVLWLIRQIKYSNQKYFTIESFQPVSGLPLHDHNANHS